MCDWLHGANARQGSQVQSQVTILFHHEAKIPDRMLRHGAPPTCQAGLQQRRMYNAVLNSMASGISPTRFCWQRQSEKEELLRLRPVLQQSSPVVGDGVWEWLDSNPAGLPKLQPVGWRLPPVPVIATVLICPRIVQSRPATDRPPLVGSQQADEPTAPGAGVDRSICGWSSESVHR